MNHDYADITHRLGPPPWYREHGVPAYGLPLPWKSGNIYAGVVVLFRIACQHCDQRFLVMSTAMLSEAVLPKPGLDGLEAWHYGDPPNHGCVGDSMNCWDYEIVRVWTKGFPDRRFFMKWQRHPECEGMTPSEYGGPA